MRQSALAASIRRFEALAFLVGFLLSVGAHADERPEARVFEPPLVCSSDGWCFLFPWPLLPASVFTATEDAVFATTSGGVVSMWRGGSWVQSVDTGLPQQGNREVVTALVLTEDGRALRACSAKRCVRLPMVDGVIGAPEPVDVQPSLRPEAKKFSGTRADGLRYTLDRTGHDDRVSLLRDGKPWRPQALRQAPKASVLLGESGPAWFAGSRGLWRLDEGAEGPLSKAMKLSAGVAHAGGCALGAQLEGVPASPVLCCTSYGMATLQRWDPVKLQLEALTEPLGGSWFTGTYLIANDAGCDPCIASWYAVAWRDGQRMRRVPSEGSGYGPNNPPPTLWVRDGAPVVRSGTGCTQWTGAAWEKTQCPAKPSQTHARKLTDGEVKRLGRLPGECLSATLVSTATADYLLCGAAGVVLVRPRTG